MSLDIAGVSAPGSDTVAWRAPPYWVLREMIPTLLREPRRFCHICRDDHVFGEHIKDRESVEDGRAE